MQKNSNLKFEVSPKLAVLHHRQHFLLSLLFLPANGMPAGSHNGTKVNIQIRGISSEQVYCYTRVSKIAASCCWVTLQSESCLSHSESVTVVTLLSESCLSPSRLGTAGHGLSWATRLSDGLSWPTRLVRVLCRYNAFFYFSWKVLAPDMTM